TVPQLRDLPIQYADFALWQQQQFVQNPYSDQADFWRDQLKGKLPILDLPCDKPRPPLQSFAGSNVFFNISRPLAAALTALAATEGCTFFMVILSAFQVLLHHYSNADDILIGTPVSNRPLQELEALVGNFLNIVILRGDLSENPLFSKLLQKNRKTTIEALSNKDLPFEKVLENVRFDRYPNRNPIFQVMLQVLPASCTLIGDMDVTNFDFDLKFSQFDLSLHLYERAEGFHGRFEYCTDLFNAETIERLSVSFRALLEAIAGNPDQRI